MPDHGKAQAELRNGQRRFRDAALSGRPYQAFFFLSSLASAGGTASIAAVPSASAAASA